MSGPLFPELLVLDAVERNADDRRPAHHERCRNCEAPLAGPYCSQCGQLDAPSDPTLRELLSDAWEAVTNLDGKVVSSLKLLLMRPGALTREYLGGRRARYLPPFRLYLLCSLGFFLMNAVPKPGAKPERDGEVKASFDSGVEKGRAAAREENRRGREAARAASRTRSEFAQRLDRGYKRLKQERGEDSLGTILREQVPNAMFVLMPLYALILSMLYRGRRLRYPVHLVFALHVHAFFFAALALSELAGLGAGLDAPVEELAGFAVFGWVLAYFPMAMRRFYGGRRWVTAGRALVLGSLYATAALALCIGAILAYMYYLGR